MALVVGGWHSKPLQQYPSNVLVLPHWPHDWPYFLHVGQALLWRHWLAVCALGDQRWAAIWAQCQTPIWMPFV